MFSNPTVSDFKNYFVRDFPFGFDISKHVVDADIERAISEASIKINQSIFCDQDEFTIAFQYLTAHILAMNIKNSSQGLSSSFEWPYSSKSVGSVSVGQSIPESVLSNPLYAYYAKTGYGVEYLMLIYPRLIGVGFTVAGGTTA